MSATMRSSNPALSDRVFQNFEAYADSSVMTVTGTAVKTMIALALTFAAAVYSWSLVTPNTLPMGLMWGGLIVGFLIAIVTMFRPQWAPITTPIYRPSPKAVFWALSRL